MNTTTPDDPTETEIQYVVVELAQVLQFFANAYKPQEGVIKNHDSFVDTAKGKVVFRLFIEKPL